jgi:hypothetical protein
MATVTRSPMVTRTPMACQYPWLWLSDGGDLNHAVLALYLAGFNYTASVSVEGGGGLDGAVRLRKSYDNWCQTADLLVGAECANSGGPCRTAMKVSWPSMSGVWTEYSEFDTDGYPLGWSRLPAGTTRLEWPEVDVGCSACVVHPLRGIRWGVDLAPPTPTSTPSDSPVETNVPGAALTGAAIGGTVAGVVGAAVIAAAAIAYFIFRKRPALSEDGAPETTANRDAETGDDDADLRGGSVTL